MIIEPFNINGFLLTDVADLSEDESNVVSTAISRGLQQFPDEFQCDSISVDPEGEFPIIRMQVSNPSGNQVYGGVWFGCNALAPGHTVNDVKIFTRPVAGPVHQFEALFWTGPVFIKIIKYLLNNQMIIRGGGTIQIMGFEYITDTSVTTEGLGVIHGAFDALVRNDPFLSVTEIPLGAGRFCVRLEADSPGPPGLRSRR